MDVRRSKILLAGRAPSTRQTVAASNAEVSRRITKALREWAFIKSSGHCYFCGCFLEKSDCWDNSTRSQKAPIPYPHVTMLDPLGGRTPENVIALCRTCMSRFSISRRSVQGLRWLMVRLALNSHYPGIYVDKNLGLRGATVAAAHRFTGVRLRYHHFWFERPANAPLFKRGFQ